MARIQNKTVNPTTQKQVITPDPGYDYLGTVTVNGMDFEEKIIDSSTNDQIITTNRLGISKLTVKGINLVDASLDASTNDQDITGAFSKVTVNNPILEELVLNLGSRSGEYNTNMDGFSKITIEDKFDDIENLVPENIVCGHPILGVKGQFTPCSYIPYEDGAYFLNYKGDIVYRFSVSEVRDMTNLPKLINHSDEGLIAQEWNYTLSEIKDYVDKIGKAWITEEVIPIPNSDGISPTKVKIYSSNPSNPNQYIIAYAQKVHLDFGSATEPGEYEFTFYPPDSSTYGRFSNAFIEESNDISFKPDDIYVTEMYLGTNATGIMNLYKEPYTLMRLAFHKLNKITFHKDCNSENSNTPPYNHSWNNYSIPCDLFVSESNGSKYINNTLRFFPIPRSFTSSGRNALAENQNMIFISVPVTFLYMERNTFYHTRLLSLCVPSCNLNTETYINEVRIYQKNDDPHWTVFQRWFDGSRCLRYAKIYNPLTGYSVYSNNHINENAFRDCQSLRRIDIVLNGKYPFQPLIENNAFDGCIQLTEVHLNCLSDYYDAISLGECFHDCPSSLKIYVPSNKVQAYKDLNPTYKDKIYPEYEITE